MQIKQNDKIERNQRVLHQRFGGWGNWTQFMGGDITVWSARRIRHYDERDLFLVGIVIVLLPQIKESAQQLKSEN